MTLIRIEVVLLVIILVTYLFKKASGGLKLTKLNMVSTIYYYIMAFNMIGASLVYLGFHNHYLIQKVRISETIDHAYYALAYAMIMFPLVLIIIKKITSYYTQKKSFTIYVTDDIHYNANMVNVQGLVLILMVVCTVATAYVFMHLSYIPIISMFGGEDINALRQSGGRLFAGNQYIKNLLMLTLTPFVSYLTYIYYRMTKAGSWRFMFFYMAALSVIVLTYDFSKAPIITYLIGLYLIEVIMGNVQNIRGLVRLIIASTLLLLFFYVVVMGEGSYLYSIYTGPLGRIFFTQIATLFLHFDAFPVWHPFLWGASFNSWMSFLLPNAVGLRSGRIVMSIYNASGVESNTAGVMNTVFIGEAYANFGTIGIIIAPIVFGVVIGLFAYLLPSLKKSPVSVLLYVQMTLQFVTMVEGGFVDIFYSASTIFIIIVALIVKMVSGNQNNNCETAIKKSRKYNNFLQ